MRTNMNFRRKLKYLKKDIQRRDGNIEEVNKLLNQFKEETGMDLEHECYLFELLKRNIPSRTLHRISNAAKKQNCFVDAKEFIVVEKCKNPKNCWPYTYFTKIDWHEIPFKRTKRILVTSKHIEEQSIFVINGKETIKSKVTIKPEFDRIEQEIQ